MPANPPKTLREAVDLLLTSLDAQEREKLRAMREDDLIGLHLGMGMWMRNSFPIWGSDELLRSIAAELRPRVAAEMEKTSRGNPARRRPSGADPQAFRPSVGAGVD